VHFDKVGSQTRQMLDGWIEEGRARTLLVTHLEELRRALPSLPERASR
jgi:hypothetical protein